MGILSKKTARVSFLAARAVKLQKKNPLKEKKKKEIATPDHGMWVNGNKDDDIRLSQQLEGIWQRRMLKPHSVQVAKVTRRERGGTTRAS